MTNENTTRSYAIDASGKRLGKVATEAARVLIGKDTVSFVKNVPTEVTVTITNASKMDINEKKTGEIYQSYSGYPGGLKSETLDHLGKRLGFGEVLRRTIGGMLPNNKLKKPRLKNLVISE